MALLGKWKWHLLQNQGELWAKVLESRYGGWRGLDDEARAANKSTWWRDLKKTTQQSYQGRAIQSGFRWKVGAGDRIKFWEDRWLCQETSLAEKYPRLYSISLQQQQTIRQMGSHTDNRWEWHFIWRRPLFDCEIEAAVNFLGEVQDRNIQQQGEDAWEWICHQSGAYSTHSAYQLLWEGQAAGSKEEGFVELWKLKIPSRIAVFAWRLFSDRLPTKKILQRRQVQIMDSSCPFCGCSEEEVSHLFFHCLKIQPIWWETMAGVNIKSALPANLIHHFLQHSYVQVDGIRIKRWQSWWMAVVWSIWQMRNSIIFSNASFNVNKLLEDAIFLIWSWLRNLEKDFNIQFYEWLSQIRQGFLYQ